MLFRIIYLATCLIWRTDLLHTIKPSGVMTCSLQNVNILLKDN